MVKNRVFFTSFYSPNFLIEEGITKENMDNTQVNTIYTRGFRITTIICREVRNINLGNNNIRTCGCKQKIVTQCDAVVNQ